MVLSAWCLVPGAQCLVLSAWCSVPGSRCPVPERQAPHERFCPNPGVNVIISIISIVLRGEMI